MFRIFRVKGIQEPIEPKYGVDNEGEIIRIDGLESQIVSKKFMLGIRIEQAEIHCQIPDAAVDSVDARKGDEQCFHPRTLIYPIQAQGHVLHDGADVFATVDEMWKHIFGVPVSSYAL